MPPFCITGNERGCRLLLYLLGGVVYNVKIYCSIGGVKLNLSVQIFASLVLSVVVGLVLGDGAIGPVKAWIAPVGTMFINLIK